MLRFYKTLSYLCALASGLVILVLILSRIGWLSQQLPSFLHVPEVPVLTISCQFIVTLALLCLYLGFNRVCRAIIMIPLVIAAITLMVYLTGWPYQPETLVLWLSSIDPGNFVDIMTPNSGVILILLGFAIYLKSKKILWGNWMAVCLAAIVLALSAAVVLNYVATTASLVEWQRTHDMAFRTAMIFMLLSLSLFLWCLVVNKYGFIEAWFAVPMLIGTLSLSLFLWKAIDINWIVVNQHDAQSANVKIILIFSALFFFLFALYFIYSTISLIVGLETRRKEAALADLRHKYMVNYISYQVRSPLCAILGFSEPLLYKELPPKIYEVMKGVHTAAQHLQNIMDDLIAYSKLEAKNMYVQVQVILWKPWYEELVRILQKRADMKQVRFIAKFMDHFPSSITSDPHKLSQIIIDVFEYILYHTPSFQAIRFQVDYDDVQHKVIFTFHGLRHVFSQEFLETMKSCDLEELDFTREDISLGIMVSQQLMRRLGGEMYLQVDEIHKSQTWICSVVG